MSSEPYSEQTKMPLPSEIKPEIQRNEQGIGLQHEMKTQPISANIADETQWVEEDTQALTPYRPADKLKGKKALITGGDSGIGRSIAIFYAQEGAEVAIAYHPIEQKDAEDTRELVKKVAPDSKEIRLYSVDLQEKEGCEKLIKDCISDMGKIDILVNNASYQMTCDNIEELPDEQMEKTVNTNVLAPLRLIKHAVPHMDKGSSIIFSTSVVAFKGSPTLVDYTATKSAMVGLIRSLARQLAPKRIRVNGVAPGPVWTPLQPISRSEEDMKKYCEKKPILGRMAQPSDIAPSYVFLASPDANQYTGQILHPNSGIIIGS